MIIIQSLTYDLKKTFRDRDIEFDSPTITWSPSHLELGLLSELLSYANMINGFKEGRKRELRKRLEIAVKGDRPVKLYENPIRDLLELQNEILAFETPDTYMFIKRMESREESMEPRMFGEVYEKKMKGKDWFFCVELCPKYIDYLKKSLKPYLKD